MEKTKKKGQKGGDDQKEINNLVTEEENVKASLSGNRDEGTEHSDWHMAAACTGEPHLCGMGGEGGGASLR